MRLHLKTICVFAATAGVAVITSFRLMAHRRFHAHVARAGSQIAQAITLPLMLCLALLCLARHSNGLAASAPNSDALRSAILPFVERGSLAGTVMLVANSNRVLEVEAVGFSNLATRQPIKPDSLFWIASQTKSMTAAALMMLVDEGKVRLDDPVEKYLPEFKGQMVAVERDSDHLLLRKPSHAITLREVLSHTSGLPFSSPMEQPTLDLLPLRDAVHSYALLSLQFEPGTKYQYSNAGINTAARVLEVVARMSYEDFMQVRLFKPLGMKDTTFRPSKAQLKRLVKSYKSASAANGLEEAAIRQLGHPLDNPRRQPVPAGGLFSTAHDVGRFCQMILNGGTLDGNRYLSEAAVKQMTTKQTGEAVKNEYGLGWMTGNNWCGHDGAYATNMRIDREHGLILIWLVQSAGYFTDDIRKSFNLFESAAKEKFGQHFEQ